MPRHPGENAFNALAKHQLDAAVTRAAAEHASGRLLDIGCGLNALRGDLRPLRQRARRGRPSLPPHAATHVDILADAYDIPVEDGSFDTALMSEVLEHLERPGDGLREAFRVLSPGGKLILTTPLT